MPQYAIISVGEGNSYGHPTELVLSRLSDANVKTYRTDLNGDIWVYSDGENITVETDKRVSKQDIISQTTWPIQVSNTRPRARYRRMC